MSKEMQSLEAEQEETLKYEKIIEELGGKVKELNYENNIEFFDYFYKIFIGKRFWKN